MWKFCKLSCNYCNNTEQKNDEKVESSMINIDESSEEDEFVNTGQLQRLGRLGPSRLKSLMKTNVDKHDSEPVDDEIKTIESSEEDNLTNSDDESDNQKQKDTDDDYQLNPIENSSMEKDSDENESDLKVVEQDQLNQKESTENFDQNDEVICEDKDRHCVKWANENRCDEKGKSNYNLLAQVIQLDHDKFTLELKNTGTLT